jgi:FMN phosphatase YigB (HAD superfamily)
MNYFELIKQEEKHNIGVDFDGVLHDNNLGFHDGTIYGEPLPGAIEAIKQLSLNFKIIIYTAKAKSDRPLVNGKTGTELVCEWLENHKILKYIQEVTSEKPRALIYIDDKGYRFENWKATLDFVKTIEKNEV